MDTLDTLVRRPTASIRGKFWGPVLLAFLVGAVGASVLFVGVWRNEASRAKSADADAQDAAAVLAKTNDTLERTQLRLGVAQGKLRRAEATLRGQGEVLRRLGAAAKPIADDAAGLDTASQRLASEGAALGDSVAKLTNAVAALGVYLKQTSPSQLDPAYLDAQLSYLNDALASLKARSERLQSEAGSVSTGRRALARHAASLEELARRGR